MTKNPHSSVLTGIRENSGGRTLCLLQLHGMACQKGGNYWSYFLTKYRFNSAGLWSFPPKSLSLPLSTTIDNSWVKGQSLLVLWDAEVSMCSHTRYVSTRVTFMAGDSAGPIMWFKFQGTILKVHIPVRRLMWITQFVSPMLFGFDPAFQQMIYAWDLGQHKNPQVCNNAADVSSLWIYWLQQQNLVSASKEERVSLQLVSHPSRALLNISSFE